MSQNSTTPEATWDDRAGRKTISIWDRWQPACDACGRRESSLKERLSYCSSCYVVKYCSAECQKRDWSAGGHKNQCHLFEIDRKLSDVFLKSLGCGSVNDPTLSLSEKVVQWIHANSRSADLIACAALKNDSELTKSMHVGIFLKLVGEPTRPIFIINKVALIQREATETWSNVMLEFCQLPGGRMSHTQKWMLFVDSKTTLPPDFDLHRYITHVNRGITHFHASFWPLPRRLPDAQFEAAAPPEEWLEYMRRYPVGFCGLQGQDVIGVERRDGTRVPLYKREEADPLEFKKLLDDPGRRRVRMVPGPK